MGRKIPVDERFKAKVLVDLVDGCWLWTGNVLASGYGQIKVGEKSVRAHRWAYERFVGPIPNSLTLDHLCRIKHCVNPEHLEAVTLAVNLGRRLYSPKTHCRRGHEYTPENVYIGVRRNGRRDRMCRICTTERRRVLRAEGPSPRRVPPTRCPHGHPYEGRNLIINSRGARVCRTCANKRAREWERNHRAAERLAS